MNFSPDRAAVQEIVASPPMEHEVHRNTIQVLQLQEWEDGIIVLVSFLAAHESGQISECLGIYETKKEGAGWNAVISGMGCGPAGAEEKPISVSEGQRSSREQSYSEVDGFVNDPEIETVEVIWADGEVQEVEVVRRSYLALRTGSHKVQTVNTFDSSGELVYTYEKPAPPPGKDTP